MIINIAYPLNGTLKKYEYKEEKYWSKLYDLRIGDEVEGSQFGNGEEGFAGHTFRVTGGSDKNGFAMKQGVMTRNKLKLLLDKDSVGYFQRRTGTRKRKSIRGCIVGNEVTSVNLILVTKGETELEGVTDNSRPLRLGPKRANKIRKLFNLPRHWDNKGKQNSAKVKVSNFDVMKAVVKRITKEVEDKKYYKAPKITRLLTAERMRRKKTKRQSRLAGITNNQRKAREFAKLMEQRRKLSRKKTVA